MQYFEAILRFKKVYDVIIPPPRPLCTYFLYLYCGGTPQPITPRSSHMRMYHQEVKRTRLQERNKLDVVINKVFKAYMRSDQDGPGREGAFSQIVFFVGNKLFAHKTLSIDKLRTCFVYALFFAKTARTLS